MTIAYVLWKDASIEEASEPGTPVHDDPLVTLEEIGWLVGESPESVSLAMELDGGEAGRNRLHIPKVNILEMRVMEFGKFAKRKRRL